MGVSQQERTLRLITVCTWIPAIALLIPYGVVTHTCFPAVGLVPLTFSAVFGLAKLFDYIRTDYHISNVTVYAVTVDGVLALMLLGFTIAGFPLRWWAKELGIFAIFPLLINMFIHTFCVFRETALVTWIEDLFKPRICQYCHRDLKTMWDMKVENISRVNNTAAIPAQQVKDESAPTQPPAAARPSTSTSNLTTPRPSTDYDAETLDGQSIRSSQSTLKVEDAGDMV